MYGSKRVAVKDLNPHILCALCGGYLIQATTVIECLHSFCRTCIVNFLETSKVCPICDVQVHKTRPLLNIRPDQTLQSLVYKLVPGLFQDEMKRRRDFHASLSESDVEDLSLEERGEASMEKDIKAEDDHISLVLQMAAPWKDNRKEFQIIDRRYLLCPCEVTVRLLKKFLRVKFHLAPHHKIQMYRAKEELTDDLMLQDVALIYSWCGTQPLHICYTVTESGHLPAKKTIKQTVEVSAESPSSATNITTTPAPVHTPVLAKTVMSNSSRFQKRSDNDSSVCAIEVKSSSSSSLQTIKCSPSKLDMKMRMAISVAAIDATPALCTKQTSAQESKSRKSNGLKNGEKSSLSKISSISGKQYSLKESSTSAKSTVQINDSKPLKKQSEILKTSEQKIESQKLQAMSSYHPQTTKPFPSSSRPSDKHVSNATATPFSYFKTSIQDIHSKVTKASDDQSKMFSEPQNGSYLAGTKNSNSKNSSTLKGAQTLDVGVCQPTPTHQYSHSSIGQNRDTAKSFSSNLSVSTEMNKSISHIRKSDASSEPDVNKHIIHSVQSILSKRSQKPAAPSPVSGPLTWHTIQTSPENNSAHPSANLPLPMSSDSQRIDQQSSNQNIQSSLSQSTSPANLWKSQQVTSPSENRDGVKDASDDVFSNYKPKFRRHHQAQYKRSLSSDHETPGTKPGETQDNMEKRNWKKRKLSALDFDGRIGAHSSTEVPNSVENGKVLNSKLSLSPNSVPFVSSSTSSLNSYSKVPVLERLGKETLLSFSPSEGQAYRRALPQDMKTGQCSPLATSGLLSSHNGGQCDEYVEIFVKRNTGGTTSLLTDPETATEALSDVKNKSVIGENGTSTDLVGNTTSEVHSFSGGGSKSMTNYKSHCYVNGKPTISSNSLQVSNDLSPSKITAKKPTGSPKPSFHVTSGRKLGSSSLEPPTGTTVKPADEISVDILSSPSSVGSSVTSPGTDVTSPGTEDRADASAAQYSELSRCESAGLHHVGKSSPLDLSGRRMFVKK